VWVSGSITNTIAGLANDKKCRLSNPYSIPTFFNSTHCDDSEAKLSDLSESAGMTNSANVGEAYSALQRAAVVESVIAASVASRSAGGDDSSTAAPHLCRGVAPWLLTIDALADAWSHSPSFATLTCAQTVTSSGEAMGETGLDVNSSRGFELMMTGGVQLESAAAKLLFGRAMSVSLGKQVREGAIAYMTVLTRNYSA
jgi:hypothetical protein